MPDAILNEMAMELRHALMLRGLDPRHPPEGAGPPPAAKAFAKYQQLGGAQYTDADVFVKDLVAKVKSG
jgi:hypothetical protein